MKFSPRKGSILQAFSNAAVASSPGRFFFFKRRGGVRKKKRRGDEANAAGTHSLGRHALQTDHKTSRVNGPVTV